MKPDNESSWFVDKAAFFKSLLCAGLLIFGTIGVCSISRPRIHPGVLAKEGNMMAEGIAQAVLDYSADHGGRFPLPASSLTTAGLAEKEGAPPGNTGTDLDTDTSAAAGWVKRMAGTELKTTADQPYLKGQDYFEFLKPAKLNQQPQPPQEDRDPQWKRGLVMEAGDGGGGVLTMRIVDPWGYYFRVRLDTNGDGMVATPSLDEVAEGRPAIRARVIVWSPGRDGKEETWEDNPTSWDREEP